MIKKTNGPAGLGCARIRRRREPSLGPRSSTKDWPTRTVRFIAPFAAARHLGYARPHRRRASARQARTAVLCGEPGRRRWHDRLARGRGGGARRLHLRDLRHCLARIAPAFSRNPPYDGLRDFTHVAYLGGPPVVLVVHASLGVHSFKEFLDLAKRTPEGLNYVSSGVGTHGFLFAEDMARREHFKLIQRQASRITRRNRLAPSADDTSRSSGIASSSASRSLASRASTGIM